MDCVSIIDVHTGCRKTTIFFLGKVPSDVLKAANSNKPSVSDVRIPTWDSKNSSILKKYYGDDWKNLLTPDSSAYSGVNLFSYHSNKKSRGSLSSSTVNSDKIPNDSSNPTYTNISIHNDDNVYTVRLKVFVATKIPIYRQHIFYFINNEGPMIPYEILIDGIPISINWNSMFDKSSAKILNISVDKNLYENKSSMIINAKDIFTYMKFSPNIKTTHTYVVDMFDVINMNNISSLILDNHLFDSLYYGAIVKFWPQLDAESFYNILTNKELTNELNPKLEVLERSFSEEDEIIEEFSKYTTTKSTTSVVSTSAGFNGKKNKIDIRNLFNKIKTSDDIMSINAVFTIDGIKNNYFGDKKYSGYKELTVKGLKQNKTHASEESWIAEQNPEVNSMYLSIYGQYHDLTIVLYSSGYYETQCSWFEEDKINFGGAISYINEIIKPSIDYINSLDKFIFPLGGSLSICNTLTNITAIRSIPYNMDSTEFTDLKKQLHRMDKMGLLSIKNLQTSNTINLHFKRSVFYDLDNSVMKLSQISGNNKYSWMFSESANERWKSLFPGRNMKITKRATDLSVEVKDVIDEDEYDRIMLYITYAIEKSKNLHKKISKMNNTTKLKKLQDIDPALFDLRRYDSKSVVYSMLCQSDRQPVIYTSDEYSLLPSKLKNSLTEYKNYTTSGKSYYGCDSKTYPYLTLSPKNHPMGYCLPCCNKRKLVEGSNLFKKTNNCIIGSDKYLLSEVNARHVLSYGKPLTGDRIGELPANVKSAIGSNLYMVGVKQTAFQMNNAGFMYSILFSLNITLEQFAKTCDAISITQSFDEDIFSDYTMNNILEHEWMDMVIDMLRKHYNTSVIMIDESENYNIITDSKILYRNVVIVFKNSQNNYYPVVEFGKAMRIIKSAFSEEDAIYQKLKDNLSSIVTVQYDLAYILTLLKKPIRIKKLLVDKKTMCYAVILSNGKTDIHMPVYPSKIIPDYEIFYGVVDKPLINREDLLFILSSINYPVNITNDLTNGSELIGFISGGLYFSHIPFNGKGISSINIPYDMTDIDRSLMLYNDNKLEMPVHGWEIKYESYIYMMFLSEFINEITKTKNLELRKEIKQILLKTDIDNVVSIKNTQTQLMEKISDKDFNKVWALLASEVSSNKKFDLNNISNMVDRISFDFDYKLLEKIKKVGTQEYAMEVIKDLMSKRVKLVDEKFVKITENYYMPCNIDTRTDYCDDGKLIVPKLKMDNLCSILAYDIIKTQKSSILNTLSFGLYEPLEFQRNNDEILKIEILF